MIIQEASDHLRVEVSGEWTPGKEAADAKRIWSQVADVCRTKGITRILSVWKVPGHLPVFAAYDIASSASETGWDWRFKLAEVHLYEERFKDSLFTEIVATNRGYSVKMFDNEQDAKKWLFE